MNDTPKKPEKEPVDRWWIPYVLKLAIFMLIGLMAAYAKWKSNG